MTENDKTAPDAPAGKLRYREYKQKTATVKSTYAPLDAEGAEFPVVITYRKRVLTNKLLRALSVDEDADAVEAIAATEFLIERVLVKASIDGEEIPLGKDELDEEPELLQFLISTVLEAITDAARKAREASELGSSTDSE